MSLPGAQRDRSDCETHPAPIPKVSEHEPETPVALVRLVDRMLGKDPAGRPTAGRACERIDRGEHAGRAADTLAGPTATLEAPGDIPGDRRGERGGRDLFRRAHRLAVDVIHDGERRGCRSRVVRVR